MALVTTQTTAPTAEPVTRAEAKLYARVTNTAEDALVDELIETARALVEARTGYQLMRATWKWWLDRWPAFRRPGADGVAPTVRRRTVSELVVPYPPLDSVTAIKYYDTDGVEQTLAGSVYTVDTDAEPGRIRLAPDQTWPELDSRPRAIEVEFDAGYDDAASVPTELKTAVRQLVADLYDRGGVVSDAHVDALLVNYRDRRVVAI